VFEQTVSRIDAHSDRRAALAALDGGGEALARDLVAVVESTLARDATNAANKVFQCVCSRRRIRRENLIIVVFICRRDVLHCWVRLLVLSAGKERANCSHFKFLLIENRKTAYERERFCRCRRRCCCDL
jgi:hypothetical protein